MHGIDGDVFGDGATYANLASKLDTFHVAALSYDDEASACESLEALADLYTDRISHDIASGIALSSGTPILIIGYSFGCVIAHRVALKLQQKSAHDTRLVLFDMEVVWPPGNTLERVGAYEWLGGDVEAALLLARALGSVDGAAVEVEKLLGTPAQYRNYDGAVARLFRNYISERLTYEEFNRLYLKAGKSMTTLNTKVGFSCGTPKIFHGKTLLILAPDSAEFATAREVNAKFCSDYQVVDGEGSHYDILQGDNVLVSVDHIRNLLERT